MVKLTPYNSSLSAALAIFSKIRLTERKTILLLILISSLFCLMRFNDIMVGTFFDDANYIILAKSLSTGHGYRLINFPQAPVEEAFPPGWPLLLAPLVALFPENFTVLKLLCLFFWLSSIPLIWKLFAKRLPAPYGLALGVFVSLSPSLIGMAGTVMSEAAYLFFSLLTLYLFEVWNRDEGKTRIWLIIVVILLAFFTLMIRTIGLTLLAGILLFLLFYRGRRYLGFIGGILLLIVIPVSWFNYQLGGAFIFSPLYKEHVNYVTSHLGDFVQIWKHFSFFSLEAFASSLIPVFDLGSVATLLSPELNRAASACLILITLFGFGLSVRHCEAKELYVGLYLGILCLWVIYTSGTTHQVRLIIPMIPFLYFYFLQAVLRVAAMVGQNYQKGKAFLNLSLFSFIVCTLLVRNYHEWRNPAVDRVVDLSVGASWIQENTPVDAIFMGDNARSVSLYIRRQTVEPGYEVPDIEEYIKSTRVSYIIIQPYLWGWDHNDQLDAYSQTQLLPFLEAHPDTFKQVYRNSAHNTSIYQVLKAQ
jgi:hypothetical protein